MKIMKNHLALLLSSFISVVSCTSNFTDAEIDKKNLPHEKEKNNMTTQAKLIEALDKIEVAKFFLDGQPHIKDAYSLISDIKFDDVAIRIPQVINIDKFSTAPLLVVISHSAERIEAVPLDENAIVVYENEAIGLKWSGKLFSEPKYKIPMPVNKKPPPPLNPKKPIRKTIAVNFDLREKADLPWQEGKYTIQVKVADWESNKVTLELTK